MWRNQPVITLHVVYRHLRLQRPAERPRVRTGRHRRPGHTFTRHRHGRLAEGCETNSETKLTAAELIEDMDDNLFERILWDTNHILHALLPDRRRSLEYELRPRSHDRELVPKANSLIESNFLIRQLYKNCY